MKHCPCCGEKFDIKKSVESGELKTPETCPVCEELLEAGEPKKAILNCVHLVAQLGRD